MHPGEIPVTEDLVRALLRAQVSACAVAPLRRVASSGTVNVLYRVGDAALARLPMMAEWGDAVAETAILRLVAPALSTRVPTVLHVGEPAQGYPCPWLLLDWIPGHPVAPGAGGIPLAEDLARFLGELWTLPVEGARAGYRVDLARHDDAVRESLAAASHLVDVAALTAEWERALAVPAWDEPPRWTHSDLLWGNVLLDAHGRLAAVIDWEAAGVGDPACDLMAAWSILGADARERMRDLIGLDDATWQRGRGWALLQAIVALPYYLHSNPGVVANSHHVLGELLHDLSAQ